MYNQTSFTGALTEMTTTLIIFSMTVSVLIVLAVVGVVVVAVALVLRLVLRRWVIPLLRKPFLTPQRMFGAPPTVRWMLAYDYWLYLLEEITGIEFNTTPPRILVGCTIISLAPAVVIGVPLFLLHPSSGGVWLFGLIVGGVVVGLYTGSRFADGGGGWFQSPPGDKDSGSGGFILGKDK